MKKYFFLVFIFFSELSKTQVYSVGDTVTENITGTICANPCAEGDDFFDYFAMDGTDIGYNRVTYLVFAQSW